MRRLIIVLVIAGLGCCLMATGCGSEDVSTADMSTKASTVSSHVTTVDTDELALFPAAQEMFGLYGYIDKRGLMVIQPQFVQAGFFSDDIAAVQLEEDGLWGCIDKTGRMVIQPRFEDEPVFSEGLLLLLGEGGLVGYLDTTGEFVIQPQYADARTFSGDLAAVRPEVDGLWGYVDRTGWMAIQPQFTEAHSFFDGLACVSWDGDTYGFIDRSGETVIQSQYEQPSFFSEGLAQVRMEADGLCGYVDKSGQMVIQQRFDVANAFSEGLAAVKVRAGDPWGYIDKTGQMAIQPQFARAGHFSNGLAPVTLEADGFYGYIDKREQMVIQPQFEYAEPFSQGLALVLPSDFDPSDPWAYVDTSGNLVWPRETAAADILDQTTVVQGEPITEEDIKVIAAPATAFSPEQITVLDYENFGDWAAAHIAGNRAQDDGALALFKREGSEWTLFDLGTGITPNDLGPEVPTALIEWAFY